MIFATPLYFGEKLRRSMDSQFGSSSFVSAFPDLKHINIFSMMQNPPVIRWANAWCMRTIKKPGI
jgi:hypothetical protein